MTGKALIVDDSLVARLSIKGILKETKLEPVEAESGEAALELLAGDFVPTIVFLDLTMPGKGGIETLRDIRSRFPALPVVVVTADIQSRTMDMVKDAGSSAIIRKPADRAEVLSAVERFVGKES